MFSKTLSFALLLATVAYANPTENRPRDECKPCNPSGAKNDSPPAVGPGLSSMYIQLLDSVKGIHFKRSEDSIMVEGRASGLCCQSGSECINVQGLNVAMCYDKFTTNYILADGSYGSIKSGEYSAKDGAKANLITGKYTKSNGESGDIFADNITAKPNVATLSIPPQFTGTGIGSAIPASELGSIVVYTTTIPAKTFTAPTVIPASTVLTTVSGRTSVVSTIPPTTITGPTTIAPKTTVITSTRGQVQETAAAMGSSSKGAAGHVSTDTSASFGMSLFTALMYAIYAL